MRKVVLYIAQSLDGKIAKPDGSVKWLEEMPYPENDDYGYAAFLDTVDTVLMGNNTYRQMQGFGTEYPYSSKESYVFTRNSLLKNNQDVNYISSGITTFVKELKSKEGKDIWLIGGAQINTLLLMHRLIDKLIVFTMPIIIGDGIPLFEKSSFESKLILMQSETYSTGVVEMHYQLY